MVYSEQRTAKASISQILNDFLNVRICNEFRQQQKLLQTVVVTWHMRMSCSYTVVYMCVCVLYVMRKGGQQQNKKVTKDPNGQTDRQTDKWEDGQTKAITVAVTFHFSLFQSVQFNSILFCVQWLFCSVLFCSVRFSYAFVQ